MPDSSPTNVFIDETGNIRSEFVGHFEGVFGGPTPSVVMEPFQPAAGAVYSPEFDPAYSGITFMPPPPPPDPGLAPRVHPYMAAALWAETPDQVSPPVGADLLHDKLMIRAGSRNAVLLREDGYSDFGAALRGATADLAVGTYNILAQTVSANGTSFLTWPITVPPFATVAIAFVAGGIFINSSGVGQAPRGVLMCNAPGAANLQMSYPQYMVGATVPNGGTQALQPVILPAVSSNVIARRGQACNFSFRFYDAGDGSGSTRVQNTAGAATFSGGVIVF